MPQFITETLVSLPLLTSTASEPVSDLPLFQFKTTATLTFPPFLEQAKFSVTSRPSCTLQSCTVYWHLGQQQTACMKVLYITGKECRRLQHLCLCKGTLIGAQRQTSPNAAFLTMCPPVVMVHDYSLERSPHFSTNSLLNPCDPYDFNLYINSLRNLCLSSDPTPC